MYVLHKQEEQRNSTHRSSTSSRSRKYRNNQSFAQQAARLHTHSRHAVHTYSYECVLRDNQITKNEPNCLSSTDGCCTVQHHPNGNHVGIMRKNKTKVLLLSSTSSPPTQTSKQTLRCAQRAPDPILQPCTALPCISVLLAHLSAITCSPLEGSLTVTAARAAAARDAAAKIPFVQPRLILVVVVAVAAAPQLLPSELLYVSYSSQTTRSALTQPIGLYVARRREWRERDLLQTKKRGVAVSRSGRVGAHPPWA